MSDLCDKVVTTKDALMASLGENGPKYFELMKMWLCHKSSQKSFDMESRKLIAPNQMHLHNQFLVAILNKIDSFYSPTLAWPQNRYGASDIPTGSNSRKRKLSTREYGRSYFQPYFYEMMKEENDEDTESEEETEVDVQFMPTQYYDRQDTFLPDAGYLMGRFLVGAWEAGLVEVEDKVVEYATIAMRTLLKNIISEAIKKCKNPKGSDEELFRYDVGPRPRDQSLKYTVTPQNIDDSSLKLDEEKPSSSSMARANAEVALQGISKCEEVRPQRDILITLKELRRAFQNRDLILSHSVYSINMERITQMMPR